MVTHQELETFLRSLPAVRLERPFGERVAVYKTGDAMFALVQEGSEPIRLSLLCDPKLARLLRERYESVMPGDRLNKKRWNTLLLTGQLSWPEVQDLIRHAYQLASGPTAT